MKINSRLLDMRGPIQTREGRRRRRIERRPTGGMMEETGAKD